MNHYEPAKESTLQIFKGFIIVSCLETQLPRGARDPAVGLAQCVITVTLTVHFGL